jgi:hypothetical protein
MPPPIQNPRRTQSNRQDGRPALLLTARECRAALRLRPAVCGKPIVKCQELLRQRPGRSETVLDTCCCAAITYRRASCFNLILRVIDRVRIAVRWFGIRIIGACPPIAAVETGGRGQAERTVAAHANSVKTRRPAVEPGSRGRVAATPDAAAEAGAHTEPADTADSADAADATEPAESMGGSRRGRATNSATSPRTANATTFFMRNSIGTSWCQPSLLRGSGDRANAPTSGLHLGKQVQPPVRTGSGRFF